MHKRSSNTRYAGCAAGGVSKLRMYTERGRGSGTADDGNSNCEHTAMYVTVTTLCGVAGTHVGAARGDTTDTVELYAVSRFPGARVAVCPLARRLQTPVAGL